MTDDDDDYLAPPKSPVPAAVIASIITSIALFFALRALEQRGLFFAATPRSRPPSAVVEVPSLLGMKAEQAREVLQGRELLLSFATEHDSAKYPAGTIAEQSPLGGSQVFRGNTVQAVLSRGLPAIPIPALTGRPAEEAARQIANLGLSLGPSKTAASDTVAAGAVIDTEPPAPTAVTASTPVLLVLSSGPAARPIPKVSGMRMRAARELLEQQGFKVGKIRYDNDGDRSGGVVLEQRPAPPANAPLGALVDLTVNEE